VWEDHLLPRLTRKDAARLVCTCKTLMVVVREHFSGDIGVIKLDKLRAALTAFPRARELMLTGYIGGGGDEDNESEALLQWLHEGGRGRHLVKVRAEDGAASDLFLRALRQGALPSLKGVDCSLRDEAYQASLSEGLLDTMHELRLKVGISWWAGPWAATLGLVRQLPALAKLELEVTVQNPEASNLVQWPPFIPRNLKALYINAQDELFYSALADMLPTSGARLDRLEFHIPSDLEDLGDGLVHVAQALRCCSPTLRGFLLLPEAYRCIDFCDGTEWPADLEEQQRVPLQWADVLAGVSACRGLEVLVLPEIGIEPLFPPGTAFRRLTHLEISDYRREHRPEAAAMGLWELMASGGLPALAKLRVTLDGDWDSVDVKTRVALAFEAVADTLTHLYLGSELRDEEAVGYELGVALGKLRRLKDLTLESSADGLSYPAITRGLAAGREDRPLPSLRRVALPQGASANVDLLASLLLPSVQVSESGVGCRLWYDSRLG
jgi:hypothetical protein